MPIVVPAYKLFEDQPGGPPVLFELSRRLQVPGLNGHILLSFFQSILWNYDRVRFRSVPPLLFQLPVINAKLRVRCTVTLQT